VGPGGPPYAPPYVRRVRIYAHGTFWFTPRLIHPFFVTHPPCASIGPSFSPLVFFFPNDLFSDWFSPFIVHLCSFSKFSSIALVKNFYFRSLIPRHVFYPYASHWSTTPLASHSSTTRAVKRSSSCSHQSFSLRFLHTFVYVHLYLESVWFDCSFCSFPSDSVILVLPSFLINFAVSENHHFPSARLIFPFFPASFYRFQFPALTASFSFFVSRIYLPFFLLLSTVLHCPFSHPYRFATG
jgi:hypothetical protein